MTKMLKIGVFTILFVAAYQLVMAQVQYKLDPAGSSIVVKGTSSLHDWEMKAEKISSALIVAEDHDLSGLSSGDVIVETTSLKSEHSLMNKKAYDALKQKSHPQIKAKLLGVEQNLNTGKVLMELTIAGKTRQVTDDFQLKTMENGKLQINGDLEIKLSDFGIEPPVALMGTIKTGNVVNVVYNLLYHK